MSKNKTERRLAYQKRVEQVRLERKEHEREAFSAMFLEAKFQRHFFLKPKIQDQLVKLMKKKRAKNRILLSVVTTNNHTLDTVFVNLFDLSDDQFKNRGRDFYLAHKVEAFQPCLTEISENFRRHIPTVLPERMSSGQGVGFWYQSKFFVIQDPRCSLSSRFFKVGDVYGENLNDIITVRDLVHFGVNEIDVKDIAGMNAAEAIEIMVAKIL